ncbi:hypothetical protein JMM81_08140 [Bacillus sp. V3B]|nr:hypothetical protein [Bacillus sp. V3B]MCQ6274932.1 hypothetical protein [Bacillus sp. V3B]
MLDCNCKRVQVAELFLNHKDAVVSLASDKATFITEQVISVNGGSAMQ